MKYPFEKMLQVRKLRENAAMRILNEKKHKEKVAADRVARMRDALSSFKTERNNIEEKLYHEVNGKCVSIVELTNFRLELEWLKMMETEHVENVRKSVELCEAAGKERLQAEIVYQQALKNMMKLNEHQRIWREAADKQLSLAEENELEESTHGVRR